MPSRIINVSNPQKPYLDDGNSRPNHYVALSYMWGTGERFVTDTHNLSAYYQESPLARLPLTFKDAIYATYMLGFEWLWIDALCIVQDSQQEVLREIASMDAKFRGAALTLFAAASDSVHKGLGRERDPRWKKPCLLNLRTTLNGQTVQGSAYVSIDCDDDPSPLYTRGWVLQEEVLSFRGLIFASDGIYWRCICSKASEARPVCTGKVTTIRELGTASYNNRTIYNGGSDDFDLLRFWISKKNPLPDRTIWQRDNHFDHWYRMISKFNTRNLTYSSDVLKALAGLANTVARLHQCTYVAGLWLEDLQVGLSWYVRGRRARTLERDMATPIGAGSANGGEDPPFLSMWSWTSVHGHAIAFRGWQNSHSRIEHEGVCALAVPEQHSYSLPNSSLVCTVQPLKLKGRLKLARLTGEPPDILDRKGNVWSDASEGAYCPRVLRDIDSDEIIGLIALDVDVPQIFFSITTVEVHCLLVMVRKKDDLWQLTCLGLSPIDQSETEFTRIGLVFVHKADWFGRFHLSRSLYLLKKDTIHTKTVSVI